MNGQSSLTENESQWDRRRLSRRTGLIPFKSTRSRSMEMTIETREKLHQVALDLIRSVFPPPKGVRLVGVALSNFRSQIASEVAELPFREM